MSNFLDQNGFKSRKLVTTYLVLLLITLGYLAAGIWPSLATLYSTFCMSALGAAGLYHGANGGVKWLTSKSGKPEPEADDPDAPEKPKVDPPV